MGIQAMPDDKAPTYHECTRCGKYKQRSDISVKRSVFMTFGRNPKTIRSRVVAWLCDECRAADPDWTRNTRKGGIPESPGREAS